MMKIDNSYWLLPRSLVSWLGKGEGQRRCHLNDDFVVLPRKVGGSLVSEWKVGPLNLVDRSLS